MLVRTQILEDTLDFVLLYKAWREISAEFCQRGHHRQDVASSRCRRRHRDTTW